MSIKITFTKTWAWRKGIFETETVERLLTLTLDASNVDEAAELEQAYDKVRKDIFSNVPVMISTVFSNPRC